MGWTKSVVAFGKLEDLVLIDAVPLDEISSIHIMQDGNGLNSGNSKNKFSSDSEIETGENTNQQQGSLSRVKSILIPRKQSVSDCEYTDSAKEFLGKGSIMAPNVIMIVTDPLGYNSGRKYYLQAQTDSDRREFVTSLTTNSRL